MAVCLWGETSAKNSRHQAENVLASVFFVRMLITMKTPREILDALGRDRIVERLGVDKRRVNRAAYEEKLPALWYAALSDMAGQDLPREAFSFKGMAQ